MVKKTITKIVYVEISILYSKKFKITKEVDWKYNEILKEDDMGKEEYDEDQYFEDMFEEEFKEEAKEMFDKHLNSDFDVRDLNWDDMEYTDIEIEEE